MKSLITTKRKLVRGLVLAALSWCISGYGLHAQNGEAKFKTVCGACHSIGQGKRVGPDLKGVADRRSEAWLLSFIKSPQGMIAKDADAKALAAEFGTVMPDQALTDAEIKDVLAYISGGAATAAVDTTPAVPVRPTSEATAAEIDYGRKLFMGSEVFSAGGPACVSCHNVTYKDVIPGGLLAKDLTGAYSRLGEDAGIMGILGSPAFPAMQQSYADHKLTEKEIFALTAFLNKVNSDKAGQVASRNPLVYGGAAGIIVIFAAVFVIWNRRKKATVKHAIYRRQLKSR